MYKTYKNNKTTEWVLVTDKWLVEYKSIHNKMGETNLDKIMGPWPSHNCSKGLSKMPIMKTQHRNINTRLNSQMSMEYSLWNKSRHGSARKGN